MTPEEINFDDRKSKVEKLLDRVVDSLERTHPEQTEDAMSDYANVLRILSPISEDINIKPITDMAKRLYVYPNRPEHNELLVEVHDLKEMLHEMRIDSTLKENTDLGDTENPKMWPWLVISAIAIIFLFKSGA